MAVHRNTAVLAVEADGHYHELRRVLIPGAPPRAVCGASPAAGRVVGRTSVDGWLPCTQCAKALGHTRDPRDAPKARPDTRDRTPARVQTRRS